MVNSIFQLPPIEDGGTNNRRGIEFQDHVAADLCLTMLSDTALEQVWCETQDDITLIWNIGDEKIIEFVQVKGDQMDQLWSIARLCLRDKGTNGKSILEKSLANDRAVEKSKFRMITARDVHSDLKLLRLKIGLSTRDHSGAEFDELSAEIKKKVGEFKSPNGNDSKYWLENTIWEVRHSIEATRNEARLKLQKLLEGTDHYLTVDQLDEVYSRFLNLVHNAGGAKYSENPQAKRIEREQLLDWLNETIQNTLHPAMAGTGEQMTRKMRDALLSADVIETAHEERRIYRRELLKPKYLKLAELDSMELEVIAKLQILKSQMDSGKIRKTGAEFHHICLMELSALRSSFHPIGSIPSAVIQGYMYSVVDRCLHRFSRN